MTLRKTVYLLLHVIIFLVGCLIITNGLSPLTPAVSQGIGTSLIATAIAGWIVFLYVILSINTATRVALVEDAGLLAAYPRRAAAMKDEYDQRLAKASDRIDIIGCGLRSLREDYRNHFEEWAARANVRVLLLDPEFPTRSNSLATMRDREECATPGAIRGDVRAFLAQTQHLRNNPKFAVRLYRALPTLNYFRIDDEAFWGPYLVGTTSRNMPTLLVRSGSFVFKSVSEHFEALWSEARSISIEEEVG